jgi:hypothetical protein
MELEKNTIIGVACGVVGGLLAGLLIGLVVPENRKPDFCKRTAKDIEGRIKEAEKA